MNGDRKNQAGALRDIYRALLRWAGRLCGADGEDLVHEALKRMLERAAFVDVADPEALRRLAFGFARNVALELYRHRAREHAANGASESCTNVDLDAIFTLRAAFAKLEPAERELLWRVDVEGTEQLAIAESLHLPAGTVRSRVTRARARLRDLVDRGAPGVPLPTPLVP